MIKKLVDHSMSGVMGVYNKSEHEAERIAAAKLWSKDVLRLVSDAA